MVTKIETLSQGYINELNCKFIEYRNEIFQEVSKNKKQFCSIEHYYIVSKALFHILTEINKSHEKYKDIILLTYYCLLKYILNIRNSNKKEECCSEFTEASALVFILISENIEFVKNEILLSSLNTDAITNQLRVCYWNHYYSPIHICMDSKLSPRLKKAIMRNSEILNTVDANILKELEEFVYKDMTTITANIESTFSNNEA